MWTVLVLVQLHWTSRVMWCLPIAIASWSYKDILRLKVGPASSCICTIMSSGCLGAIMIMIARWLCTTLVDLLWSCAWKALIYFLNHVELEYPINSTSIRNINSFTILLLFCNWAHLSRRFAAVSKPNCPENKVYVAHSMVQLYFLLWASITLLPSPNSIWSTKKYSVL